VVISTLIIVDPTFSISYLYSRKAILITTVCVISLYYNDLYNLKVTRDLAELTIRLLQSLGISSIFLSLVYYIFPNTVIDPLAYITGIIIAILFVFAWRIGYYFILERGFFNQNIALIGSTELAQEIYNQVSDEKDCGYEIGLIVSEMLPNKELKGTGAIPTISINETDDLHNIATKLKIKKIIVALNEKKACFPFKELLDCRVGGIDILDGSSFYEKLAGKLSVEQVDRDWLIYSEGFRHSNLKRFIKRCLDLIISAVLSLLLLPFILLLAIIIKVDSRGPVIFSQERVGGKRKPFQIYKFRSMIDNAERQSGPKWAEDNDPRITRVGGMIRKWRIDEIPQLWNVLKGEMSFVGPRPERAFFVKQLEEQIPYYGKRFTLKPGLTGWAQVSYGYGASVEDAIEKLNYDLFYVKNMSFLMDLVIILRTIKIVLFGKGAR
jgi:sugar transferase (PEP-CTERM system associated)